MLLGCVCYLILLLLVGVEALEMKLNSRTFCVSERKKKRKMCGEWSCHGNIFENSDVIPKVGAILPILGT
jgi:hypothetical protein